MFATVAIALASAMEHIATTREAAATGTMRISGRCARRPKSLCGLDGNAALRRPGEPNPTSHTLIEPVIEPKDHLDVRLFDDVVLGVGVALVVLAVAEVPHIQDPTLANRATSPGRVH